MIITLAIITKIKQSIVVTYKIPYDIKNGNRLKNKRHPIITPDREMQIICQKATITIVAVLAPRQ